MAASYGKNIVFLSFVRNPVLEEFLSPRQERGTKDWRNRAGVCVFV